ncbi:hypothetical protein D3C80_1838980 [compost metagenome]
MGNGGQDKPEPLDHKKIYQMKVAADAAAFLFWGGKPVEKQQQKSACDRYGMDSACTLQRLYLGPFGGYKAVLQSS